MKNKITYLIIPIVITILLIAMMVEAAYIKTYKDNAAKYKAESVKYKTETSKLKVKLKQQVEDSTDIIDGCNHIIKLQDIELKIYEDYTGF